MGIARNIVRVALAAHSPQAYKRASKASIVDAVEPELRKFLQLEPALRILACVDPVAQLS